MGKNRIKKYWSPVWGKVVDGISFVARSEMGGGMVVTSDERVIRIIEGSKAFRAGRVKEIGLRTEDEGLRTKDEGQRSEVEVESSLKRYEDVVAFQMAKDIVMKAMRDAGEEVVIMKSKVEVKREAARLGIEFPNLK